HSNQDLLLFKAECLAQLKEYTNAIPCINEYISLKPDSKKALYMLANAFYNLQQWEDAAKSWESYLKIAPNDSRASVTLGGCYDGIRDCQKADQSHGQARLKIAPHSSERSLATSYYWLALMQIKNNNSTQAIRALDEVVNGDQELNGGD